MHGEIHAELRWQLRHHFDSDIVVLDYRRLGSRTAAQRAIAGAVRRVAAADVLLLCLAGHAAAFARRSGTIIALALPNSVPGRPGSMLTIADLAQAVCAGPASGKPLVVCADLVCVGNVIPGIAAALPGAAILASQTDRNTGPERTCHSALAAELGVLAAAGASSPVTGLLEAAGRRIAATTGVPCRAPSGGEPSRLVQQGRAIITSRYTTEQLPDYVRDDLFSPDPGSRLDAVTELASLARSTPFARTSLLRLADSDRNEAVRGFADTMTRQSQQPSLRRLLDDGVIPPDVWKAAVNDPDLPQLLHHPGGRVPVGVDAPDGQNSCRPRHTVTVAAYQLARTVVTNRQYLAFLASAGGPCPDHWQTDDSLWTGDDLPVVMVSWLDATRYCAWLTRHLHHTGVLDTGRRIVLPSEVEWEAAAGNHRGLAHPWGNHPDPGRANIRATGIGAVVAPGRFSPDGDNEAGCQDLIGNVWEWTRSLWGHSGHHPTFGYPYLAHDGREERSTRPGARYIIRGGAFYYATECANSYTRNRMLATDRHPAGGFRVACVDTPQTAPS